MAARNSANKRSAFRTRSANLPMPRASACTSEARSHRQTPWRTSASGQAYAALKSAKANKTHLQFAKALQTLDGKRLRTVGLMLARQKETKSCKRSPSCNPPSPQRC